MSRKGLGAGEPGAGGLPFGLTTGELAHGAREALGGDHDGVVGDSGLLGLFDAVFLEAHEIAETDCEESGGMGVTADGAAVANTVFLGDQSGAALFDESKFNPWATGMVADGASAGMERIELGGAVV